MLLSDEEYADICAVIPDADSYIDSFSQKLIDHGYRYANHHDTILSWWRADKSRHKKKPKKSGGSFDTNEFFEKAVAKSYDT